MIAAKNIALPPNLGLALRGGSSSSLGLSTGYVTVHLCFCKLMHNVLLISPRFPQIEKVVKPYLSHEGLDSVCDLVIL